MKNPNSTVKRSGINRPFLPSRTRASVQLPYRRDSLLVQFRHLGFEPFKIANCNSWQLRHSASSIDVSLHWRGEQWLLLGSPETFAYHAAFNICSMVLGSTGFKTV